MAEPAHFGYDTPQLHIRYTRFESDDFELCRQEPDTRLAAVKGSGGRWELYILT